MRTTIDAAGRLVIPAAIRREAGLRPGMKLDVKVRHGEVVIEPAPLAASLERRGRFVVAVPEDDRTPQLTADVVDETRSEVLDERRPN